MPKHYKYSIDSSIEFTESILSDTRIQSMEKISKNTFRFIIAVQSLISKNSFFIKWDNDTANEISEISGISVKEIDLLLNKACDVLWFDQDLFNEYSIITSIEIQKRWFDKVRRRKIIVFDKKISLLRDEYISKIKINGEIKFEDLVSIPINEVFRSSVNVEPRSITTKEDNQQSKPKSISHIPQKGPTDLKTSWAPIPFTADEVHQFISLTWEQRTEVFRQSHKRSWYESYVKFYQNIFENYRNILISNYQMTFKEYIQVLDRKDGKRTEDDYKKALIKIVGAGVNQDMSIANRIISYTPPVNGKYQPNVNKPKILKDNS